MNETVISSQKLKLKKPLAIVWGALALLLVLAIVLAYVKYRPYHERQEAAVALTLAATSKFDSYKSDHEKMLEKMYDFYNPGRIRVRVEGITYDNKDAVDSAKDADRALGKAMTTLGYDCYYGSGYLEYTGFWDYTTHNTMTSFYLWGVLAVLALAATVWYAADSRKAMIIDGDRVICRNGKKTAKEFLLKDVTSVSKASLKGLAVRGSGIHYQIHLLANGEELKTAITDGMAAAPAEPAAAGAGSADELKKFKDLIDSGVITQE